MGYLWHEYRQYERMGGMMKERSTTRGPGQPPKGAKGLTETIRIRVTASERARIERAAAYRSEGLSEFCRGALKRSAKRAGPIWRS